MVSAASETDAYFQVVLALPPPPDSRRFKKGLGGYLGSPGSDLKIICSHWGPITAFAWPPGWCRDAMGIALTHGNRKSNHFAAPGRAASTEEKKGPLSYTARSSIAASF